MPVRQMSPGEEASVCAFVLKVFEQFEAPMQSDLGIREFHGFVDPDALSQRTAAGGFVLIHDDSDGIAGVIEVRHDNHIAHVVLLFVAGARQRQGIARALLSRACEEVKMRAAGVAEVTVNAARAARPAYERLGFEAVDREQEMNGIRVVPMVKRL